MTLSLRKKDDSKEPNNAKINLKVEIECKNIAWAVP